MKSKISLYTIIGILLFILVATICLGCTVESGTYEDLEWEKSEKLAEGMSEEEATEAVKKEIEKEEQEDRDYDDMDEGGEYINGDEDDDEEYNIIDLYKNIHEPFWRRNAKLPDRFFPFKEEKFYNFTSQQALKFGIIDEIVTRKTTP